MVEGSERYTIDQFVRAAKDAHLTATERLIVDWVVLGLLDRPEHRGAGQRRGSEKGTWPFEQRQLFLSLLSKRPEVQSVATLANIPVWFWLVWGDRYAPLRQVRRALSTWAGRQWTSEAKARRAARQLVVDFGTREPRTKTDVIDLLTDSLRGTRLDDELRLPELDELRTQLERLGEGQTIEMGGAKFSLTPAGAAQLISARVDAIRHLNDFSDAAFHWARFTYNVGRAHHGRLAPELAKNDRFGHMFQDTSLEAMFNGACLDLITTLGLSRMATYDESPLGLHNPRTWEQDNLRMQINHTRVGGSGYELVADIVPADPEL
jgi:hypothetical protein